jgi:hypothetical protein
MKERPQAGPKPTIRINSKLVEAGKDKENKGDWANVAQTKFRHKNSKSIGSQKSRDRYSSQKKKIANAKASETSKLAVVTPYKEYIDTGSEKHSPQPKNDSESGSK